MSYWKWLFKGNNGKPGICRFWDFWLLIHIVIGFAISYFLPIQLKEAANTVLLPLAGIFIGLGTSLVLIIEPRWRIVEKAHRSLTRGHL
jgi:hypothetical protein